MMYVNDITLDLKNMKKSYVLVINKVNELYHNRKHT